MKRRECFTLRFFRNKTNSEVVMDGKSKESGKH